jgi:aldose 1-epimerase
MTIRSFLFGLLNDVPVPGFVLSTESGIEATLVAYGARLTGMLIPDRHGRLADVVLGFDDLAGYQRHTAYFGATCGRFSNRIADGSLRLDGRAYQLERNENGRTHLHGGAAGFDRKLWTATADERANAVHFGLLSPDGDGGYPGDLAASVSYRLSELGELAIRMTAATDQPTVVNLVHHSYWNLAGHAAGDVRNHRLTIDAGHYLPVDERLIPTGEIAAVAGTPFDFTSARQVGAAIDAHGGLGFDHNWCLAGMGDRGKPSVRLVDAVSGRGFEVETNQPGLQFYSAGALPADGPEGKSGARYTPFAGIVLETQGLPNAPNVGHFPSARLAPGTLYDHRMSFRFFAE